MPVYAAGDALEIAEASSAMFNGKIAGLVIAKDMGYSDEEIPAEWYAKAAVLKAHPGAIKGYQTDLPEEGVFLSIIHCLQERFPAIHALQSVLQIAFIPMITR